MLVVVLKIPAGDERRRHAYATVLGDLWQQRLIGAFPLHVLLFAGQVDGVIGGNANVCGAPPVKESRTGAKTWKENSKKKLQIRRNTAARRCKRAHQTTHHKSSSS